MYSPNITHNKTQISNLVRTTRFWNNFYQIILKSKGWKTKYFQFWEQANQRPKQDSQTRLMSPIQHSSLFWLATNISIFQMGVKMFNLQKLDLYLFAHFAKFPRGYIITVVFPSWSANPIKQLTSLTAHCNYLRFPTG